MLVSLSQKYGLRGVQFVGIAIDNVAKVSEFAASFKISYPVLIAGADGLDLMRSLGNTSGALPYTVVANRDGAVVHRQLGILRQPDLEALLESLTRG